MLANCSIAPSVSLPSEDPYQNKINGFIIPKSCDYLMTLKNNKNNKKLVIYHEQAVKCVL